MALLLLPAAACVSTWPHAEFAATEPVFSPQAFFTGRTVGDGVLRVDWSRARQVHVLGEGHVEADETVVLVQQVSENGSAPRTRTWRLRPVSAGHFSGTLSDASGPVAADVHGNLLHVKFTARGGLAIEQWLYLQRGGRSAINRMVVRKFGIPVATLDETIRRIP